MKVQAEQINSMISMSEAWERYCNESISRGYAHCPFHSEDTASFRLYPHSFYCFGCDIIRFVQLYFNLGYMAAVVRLNYDFGLGLSIGEPMDRHMRAELRQEARRRREQQRIKQEEQEAAQTQFRVVWDEWIRMDKNMRDYAPDNSADPIHPLHLEAVQNLGYQEYLIDCLA